MWFHFGQITFKDSKSQLIVSSSGQYFFVQSQQLKHHINVCEIYSKLTTFWWESCHQLLENSKDWSLSDFIFNELQVMLGCFCVISRLHCRLWTWNFLLFWEHPFYRNSQKDLCRFDISVAVIQQCPEK